MESRHHNKNEIAIVAPRIDHFFRFFSFYGLCTIRHQFPIPIKYDISQKMLQQVQLSLTQTTFPFCAACQYYPPNDTIISYESGSVINAFNTTIHFHKLPIIFQAPCIHSFSLGNGLTRYFEIVSCAELAGKKLPNSKF